jgi:hypothetical protein
MQDDKVGISAKFGGAVYDACLSAYEKSSYAELLESRKDFEDRVRGQGCLQALDIAAIIFLIPVFFEQV